MPHLAQMLAYATATHSLIGIPANVVMLYLTVFKTPPTFKTYSKILFISALCDLIGACMVPALIPRDVIFKEANVLDYNGLCTLSRVELCWACTGVIEMMIALNDAFVCVSFYHRLRVINGQQPSGTRTCLTIFFMILLHAPLCFGYIEGPRTSHNIAAYTNDMELAEELRNLTHYAIINFADPLALAVIGWSFTSALGFFFTALYFRNSTIRCLMNTNVHLSTTSRNSQLMLVRALNIQLLILGCFFTGATLYSLMFIGVMRSSVALQFSVFAVSGLQFTLAPIANIMFIKPYRSALRCGSQKPIVQVPRLIFTFSTASNNYTQ